MAYKDKDRQREADRERQRRYRGRDKKGVTEGVTRSPIPKDSRPIIPTGPRIATGEISVLPLNFGQSDCQCKHCRQSRVNKSKNIINHGPYKTFDQLMSNEVNRVSLLGDVDYIAIAQHIAEHGGEASFKTVKGKVQDLHITEPGKASGRPLDGLTVGKCSQVGLKVSQGQGGAKKGITPQGGGGADNSTMPRYIY